MIKITSAVALVCSREKDECLMLEYVTFRRVTLLCHIKS